MAATAGKRQDRNPEVFELLVVCAGNLCRSPMAEHLLRDRLARLGDQMAVSSAGLAARPGLDMESHALRFLRDRGVAVAPGEFASRPLTYTLVEAADLVLTADHEQTRHVAALARGAWARTFSLREFARLITTAPTPLIAGSASDARALVNYANTLRLDAGQSRPGEDDVPDPIGRRYSAFKKAGSLIEESIETIVSRLMPPAG